MDGGEDAKLLAGGHSLIPLMKLRLAAPSLLVDLRKVPGLHGVERQNGHWRVGALTTHTTLETSDLGVVSAVAATIADMQVRNRGTIGGSLAHGDAASDLPAAMLITEAEVTLQGPDGQRTVAAADLFKDYMTTEVGEHEVLTEIRIPALDGWGYGHQKFNRRSEDWAMVGGLRRRQGVGRDVRGRPHRPDAHGLGAAAGDRRRGGAARPGALGREHRQGRRAGGRGHQPAHRSQRLGGVQAASGAGADPAGDPERG